MKIYFQLVYCIVSVIVYSWLTYEIPCGAHYRNVFKPFRNRSNLPLIRNSSTLLDKTDETGFLAKCPNGKMRKMFCSFFVWLCTVILWAWFLPALGPLSWFMNSLDAVESFIYLTVHSVTVITYKSRWALSKGWLADWWQCHHLYTWGNISIKYDYTTNIIVYIEVALRLL